MLGFRMDLGRIAIAALAILGGGTLARGQLIISEVVDATLTGGLPKFVELTNVGCADVDLAQYSIGNINNGAGSLGFAAGVLSGILAPGDSYIISYENSDGPGVGTFFTVYGFDPDNFTQGSFINGDDVIVLFQGAALAGDNGNGPNVVDKYGVVGIDGTGQCWDYEDSYAYRLPAINVPAGPAFSCADWFIAGANVLDGANAATIISVTTPGVHNFTAPNCASCGDGIVDAGEDCDGGACCTSNCTFAPSSLECRSAAGLCDAAESCTGDSADCPADAVQAAGFECRAPSGICDTAESCDGLSTDCPVDGFEPSSTECRASTGDCDVAEFCSGSTADCPADGFEPNTTECRAAAGDCDIAELCTGTAADCPADIVEPSTTVCRPAVDECDLAESCTGADFACPGNTFAASGTACADDGDECTSDQCNGSGVCNHTDSGACGACCSAVDACLNGLLPDTCVAQGGTSAGAGTTCMGDVDGDSIDDLCDECPGVDDTIFAPGCVGAIPTVSSWGLVILALAMLTLGKVFGFRRVAARS